MRIHYLQHVPFEDLGYIETWLHENRMTVSCTRLFEDGQFPEPGEFDGLIILGGPMSVNDVSLYPWLKQEIRFIEEVIANGKPILGICLGAQLIAKAMGSNIYKNPYQEIGWFPIKRINSSLQNWVETLLPEQAEVFHWHGETFEIPAEATHLASSRACANQAFLWGDRVLGLQFHLEITRKGLEMLIQHCKSDLSYGPYSQQSNELLRDKLHFQRLHSLLNPILEYLFLNQAIIER